MQSVIARIDKSVPTDPVLKVRPPKAGADFIGWNISTDLTDRWGDLNFFNEANKPLDPLIDDPVFLAHLVEQMHGEDTFVARKDGVYGILFEYEFNTSVDEANYPSAIDYLQREAGKLQEKFPWASLGIPDPEYIYECRAAIWAFVASDASTAEQRNELGAALASL